MDVYGLKNCDTCKKAMKVLTGAALRDVRVDGIPEVVLSAAYAKFGAALVNRQSTTWRNLPEAERARPELELIKENPALMKRPLIVDGDKMFLGWGKDVQATFG